MRGPRHLDGVGVVFSESMLAVWNSSWLCPFRWILAGYHLRLDPTVGPYGCRGGMLA